MRRAVRSARRIAWPLVAIVSGSLDYSELDSPLVKVRNDDSMVTLTLTSLPCTEMSPFVLVHHHIYLSCWKCICGLFDWEFTPLKARRTGCFLLVGILYYANETSSLSGTCHFMPDLVMPQMSLLALWTSLAHSFATFLLSIPTDPS